MKEKTLLITVEDKENCHRFNRVIGHDFINNQDMHFKVNFESPEDVFVHLAEHFSEVIIKKGVLRFCYASGKKQQMREMVIELQQ